MSNDNIGRNYNQDAYYIPIVIGGHERGKYWGSKEKNEQFLEIVHDEAQKARIRILERLSQ